MLLKFYNIYLKQKRHFARRRWQSKSWGVEYNPIAVQKSVELGVSNVFVGVNLVPDKKPSIASVTGNGVPCDMRAHALFGNKEVAFGTQC